MVLMRSIVVLLSVAVAACSAGELKTTQVSSIDAWKGPS